MKKGSTATVINDFYTDDEMSFGKLIKAGSEVFIKDVDTDGTCYAEYLDFGFSINKNLLTQKP